MKMKKVLYLSLISMVTIFYSCNNEPAEVITTSSDALTVNPLNVSQSLTIGATSTWSAVSSDSWCTLSDSTGTGNKTVLLTCQDNLTCLSRTATITVLTKNQTKTITVNQGGGTVILAENFADNTKSWIQQIDSVTNSISNGYFDIANVGKYYSYYVGTKSLIPLYSGNYLISTDYKIISGTAPFGLTFGNKDSNNFYRLLIFPSGGFSIYRKLSGVYSSILSASTPYVRSENAVKLVKSGNICNIYLNEHKVGTFDFPTPYGAYVGFYSCPQTEIAVDYLKINQF
jgi:hypothetical protein